MPIRFVVDENTTPIGKALVEVRDDITYVGDPGNPRRGRPPCPVTRGMPDATWLPIVGANGWAVITRDTKIRTRPGELALVQAHDIVVFALTSAGSLTSWDLLDVLVHRWGGIEAAYARGGPAVHAVTRSAVRAMPLAPASGRRT